MRQHVIRLVRTAGLFLVTASLLLANQATAAALCVDNGYGSCSDSGTLFGQTQAYDVLLRGNGEAVVSARITLTNNDTNPQSTLKYHVVNGQLGGVTAFQQVACSSLPILKPDGSNATDTMSSSSAAAGTTSTVANSIATTELPECYPALIEHPLNTTSDTSTIAPNSKNTQLSIYYPSGSIYKKMTTSQSDNTFTLTLPQPVANGKSTTVVMLYNLTGVAPQSLGVFHYTFKTLQSALPVSDVSVAVSVDENYVLADAAKGKVNYSPATSGSALSTDLQVGHAQTASGANAQSYVASIGSNGAVYKHAASLASQETLTVTGRYASSSLLLNWPRTLLRWVIVLAVVAVPVYWYVRRRKRLLPRAQAAKGQVDEPHKTTSKEQSSGNTKAVNLQAMPLYTQGLAIKRYFQERRLRPLFFAWLCVVATLALVGLLLWADSLLANASYSGSGSGVIDTILYPLAYLVLAAIGVAGFLLLCVGLPILYAQGFRRAMRVFVHILISLIVVGAVLVMAIIHFGNSNNDTSCGGGLEAGSGSGCIEPQ